MSLATIAAAFETAAAEALKDAENEGLELSAELVETAGAGIDALVDKYAASATTFVVALLNDNSLSGLEKADLSTRQLVEKAALDGITLADHEATFFIKNAYEGAAAYLRSLKS